MRRILELAPGETTYFVINTARESTQHERYNATSAAWRALGRLAGDVHVKGNRVYVTRKEDSE